MRARLGHGRDSGDVRVRRCWSWIHIPVYACIDRLCWRGGPYASTRVPSPCTRYACLVFVVYIAVAAVWVCHEHHGVREIAGVADFHQAITLTNKSIKHSERLDPLEGLSSAQREEYYYRMASILDREVLEIYPESNQYLSDSDFDYDDY